MAYFDVEESFYFEQKLAQLKALDPALYGNWEVAQVQAAFAEAGLSAQEHFDQYGWAEELSANATFDVAKYLAAKAAQLNETAYEGKTDWTSADVVAAFQAAGLSAEAHFTQYGEAEGLEAQPVEGAPSTLTEALAALKAAQDAKAAFLKAQAIEGETDVAVTQARLEKAVTDAETALVDASAANGDLLSDGTTTATEDGVLKQLDVSFASTDTDGVKAAKLADAQTAAQKKITDATTALKAAQTAIDAKPALAAAAKTVNDRADAYTAATKAVTAAEITEAGDFAALKKAVTTATTDTAPTPTGAVASIIEVGTDGKLKLVKTWAEASTTTAEQLALANKLIASSTVRLDAEKKEAAIALSLVEAKAAAYVQDFTTAADTDFLALANELLKPSTAYTVVNDELKSKVTGNAISNELTALKGLVTAGLASSESIVFDADGLITNTITVPSGDTTSALYKANEAKTAYNALWGKVDTFVDTVDGATTAENTTLLKDLAAKKAALESAEDLSEALNELLADLTEATEVTAELKAKTDAVTEANEAFEALGLEVPQLVDALKVATAENDLYLAGSVSAEIVNFGLQGDDLLFIGTQFTKNAGALKDGNDAVLEVFFIQDGNNAQVVLETKPYGSNEDGVDEITITLTGVKAADLTLTEDGFVTLA